MRLRPLLLAPALVLAVLPGAGGAAAPSPARPADAVLTASVAGVRSLEMMCTGELDGSEDPVVADYVFALGEGWTFGGLGSGRSGSLEPRLIVRSGDVDVEERPVQQWFEPGEGGSFGIGWAISSEERFAAALGGAVWGGDLSCTASADGVAVALARVGRATIVPPEAFESEAVAHAGSTAASADLGLELRHDELMENGLSVYSFDPAAAHLVGAGGGTATVTRPSGTDRSLGVAGPPFMFDLVEDPGEWTFEATAASAGALGFSRGLLLFDVPGPFPLS